MPSMFKGLHRSMKLSRLTNKVNKKEMSDPFRIVEFLYMLNYSHSSSNPRRLTNLLEKKEKPSKRIHYLLRYREERKSSEK